MKMPLAEDAEEAEVRREKQSRPRLYLATSAARVASRVFRARRNACVPSLLQRKPRLASIQGLDLRLLIDAQDDGVIWRIQIQAHDIHQLFFKMGIIADLETHDTVGFETILLPDATHRAFTHACGPCHRSPTPVCRVLRIFLQGLLDDVLPLRGNHPGLSATPSTFLFDSSKPRCLPALEAFPRRPEIAAQGQTDVPKGFTVCTAKNDFRPEDLSRRRISATRHFLQALPLLFT